MEQDMSGKNTLSVSLKEEFNAAQCLDAIARIRAVPGVKKAVVLFDVLHP